MENLKLTRHTKKLDAILLAGEGESSYKVYHKHKAFLEINGKSLFLHVMEALTRVESIGRIYVIGQKEKLQKVLDRHEILKDSSKPVEVIQQKNNLYENIWHAFLNTLPVSAQTPELDEARLEESEFKDKPVLIVPCDSPLITSHEVDYFIQKSDLSRYDHIVGLVSDKTLEPFYPKDSQPGVRMAYLHLKENNYRINNLHLVKPLRVGNRKYIQEMYQYRYQRDIKNVIPFAISLFFKDHYRGYRYYVSLIMSMICAKWRLKSLVRFFSRWVPKKDLELWVSKGLKTRFAGLEVPFPGAALDVDNEKDFEAIKSRFEEWKQKVHSLCLLYPLSRSRDFILKKVPSFTTKQAS